MRGIVIVMSALMLMACAGDVEPVAESAGTASLGGSVTYRYKDDISDAAVPAAAHCAKYRKRAYLRSTARAGDDNLATYDCR